MGQKVVSETINALSCGNRALDRAPHIFAAAPARFSSLGYRVRCVMGLEAAVFRFLLTNSCCSAWRRSSRSKGLVSSSGPHEADDPQYDRVHTTLRSSALPADPRSQAQPRLSISLTPYPYSEPALISIHHNLDVSLGVPGRWLLHVLMAISTLTLLNRTSPF